MTRLRDLFFALMGGYLFYLCYRDTSFQKLLEGAQQIHWHWVVAAVVTHLVNHALRAHRWHLLLQAQGYKPGWGRTFLGEMSGFFANTVPFIPRAGEWLRCMRMQHLAGIPVRHSLGTIIVERGIDMCCFAGILGVGLLVGADTLYQMARGATKEVSNPAVVGIAVLLGSPAVARWLWWRYQGEEHPWARTVIAFVQATLASVRATRKAASWELLGTTAAIWTSHFLVEWMSLGALDATAKLGLTDTLFLFIALNLGMAAPTPGGMGTFDAGMMLVLRLLHVARKPALLYTFLMHSIQLFNAVVVGGGCFLATLMSPAVSKAAPSQQVASRAV